MTYLTPEWRDQLLAAGFPSEALPTGEAEEILNQLPKYLGEYQLTICPQQIGWGVAYHLAGRLRPETPRAVEKTLVEAAVSMYVALAELKLLGGPPS